MKIARSLLSLFAVVVLMVGIPTEVQAATISCGVDRIFEMTNVSMCVSGSGNGKETAVEADLGGDWTEVGEVVDPGNASNPAVFNVALTSGSWGGGPVITGTYSIDPSFWSTWGMGAISAHVGGGQGVTDHWTFKVDPNTLSGDWNYLVNNSNGGGLSNLKLFGTGEGVKVPELSTLLLLGTGLAMVGLKRRRNK